MGRTHVLTEDLKVGANNRLTGVDIENLELVVDWDTLDILNQV